MEKADDVFVSPVSLFEIGQKVRRGKWPEMAPFVQRLPALLQQQGGRVAALTPEICLDAAILEWRHRDVFDRLLAASAIASRIAIISADTMFDGLAGLDDWIARLW
jgi:PIN domain nuclease of toxin-antitoxin system